MTHAYAPWMTEPDLAERVVRWALDGAIEARGDGLGLRVIEPSAGDGAIALRLFAQAEKVRSLTCVELHAERFGALVDGFSRFVDALPAEMRERELARLDLRHRDFIAFSREQAARDDSYFDLSVGNPPYDGGADTDHVSAALDIASEVVAIVRSAFKHGDGRAGEVFERAELIREAVLVKRPTFRDGTKPASAKRGTPRHEFTVLHLRRRPVRVPIAEVRDNPRVEWWQT